MTELAHTESDPFATSLAGRRLDRYEVLARLASGGMAAVYVARALGVAGFERLFAVKVLHPHLAHEEEFITMFLDEARLAARIRHPNVVPTTDISDTRDAGFYLVMDYIEGDHLGALLQHAFKRGARIPAPMTLRIVADALEGLSAAHQLTNEHGEPINLVHRDVSPHNIMVSTDGVSRITDFGVAKASIRLSTTQEGQFKGKLAYMAPEHATNGQSDQRSDLFAMAIILWECLTGRRLFRAENHAATLNKICLEPIPLPSTVDPALAPFDPILERGLARDPNRRFQTAEEFAEAIEHAAVGLGGMANHRAVAKLVRDLAADKIARDQALIKAAIAELASTPPEPRPEHPSPPSGVRPQPPRAEPVSEQPAQLERNGAPAPQVAPQRAPQAPELAPQQVAPQPVPAAPPDDERNGQIVAHGLPGGFPGQTPADFESDRVRVARAAADAAAARVAQLEELKQLEEIEDARRRGAPRGLWLGSAMVALAMGIALTAALWGSEPYPGVAPPSTDTSNAINPPATGTQRPTSAQTAAVTTPTTRRSDHDNMQPAVTPERAATDDSNNQQQPVSDTATVDSDEDTRGSSQTGRADDDGDEDDLADGSHRARARRRSGEVHAPDVPEEPAPAVRDVASPATNRTTPTLRVRKRPEPPAGKAAPSTLSTEDDLLLNPYR